MIRSQQERLVDIITRRHLLLQNLNAFIDEWHQSSIHYEPSLIGGLDHSLPQRLYKRRRGLDGILTRALSPDKLHKLHRRNTVEQVQPHDSLRTYRSRRNLAQPNHT